MAGLIQLSFPVEALLLSLLKLVACNQLKSNSSGSPPNTVIDVLTILPPNNKWSLMAQTEVVEASHNPLFLKTVGLGDTSTPLQTRVKLLVYDVKELETGIVCTVPYCTIPYCTAKPHP